ncbi:slipin family protein [Actinoallomurus iriomotensis]|uniref:slipin family protein n=1 Tax=Actinoallomurus iriomotensis TaxID=478107 RepID=UPI002556466B|nr:slipin family protein [Actinoallomurus iriomotensis]
MAEAAIILLCVLAFFVLLIVISSVKVVQQVERGVVFRLGQVQSHFRAPGLTLIFPMIDRMTKVNMQTVAMGVPAQEGITQDNVSVRVDAVVYFRVIDPVKAIVNVQNYNWAVSQVAQTSLRSVIGQADMQQLLSDRETINAELQRIMDQATEAPWGIKVQRVEIKDVSLPEGMKRSMARQAEAERERRARIITADGEFQASKRLAAAAEVMAQDPASLQLRLLQTVVEVAAEKNSTLVMPFPVELLRFFDRAAGGDQTPREGTPRTDLAERLAKAEEDLARAAEPSSIDSVKDVPPVPGLESDAPVGHQGIEAPRDRSTQTPNVEGPA